MWLNMALRLTSPCKLFVADLKNCERRDHYWCLPLKDGTSNSALVQFDNVWLQGNVSRISGNDAFTLNDCTGEAVIKTTSTTQGNISLIPEGSSCLVLGTLLHVNPPTVGATKLSYLRGPHHANSWDMEVQEAKCVLAKPPTQLQDSEYCRTLIT